MQARGAVSNSNEDLWRGNEYSDLESASSDLSYVSNTETGDPLDAPVAKGKFHRRTLTFKDGLLEDEFMRRFEDRNLEPATRFLSVCCAMNVALLLLFRTGPSTSLSTHLLCANIIGVLCSGVPILVLRRRWCSCETATLAATVLMSGSVFTQSAHFMAKAFHFEGDFFLHFFYDEPLLILALSVMNSSVQAMRLRSSRCWILPMAQFLMLLSMHLAMAPWSWRFTVFISALWAVGAYFPWRGRRKDERRARIDFLENRELRLKMSQDRAANKVQTQRLREIEDRLAAMDAWAGLPSQEMPRKTAFAAGLIQEEMSCEEDPTAPPPPQCVDPDFSHLESVCQADVEAAAPNHLLRFHMAGRRADAVRIRRMAEQIRWSDYSIKDFFDDAIAAFPELELFYVMSDDSMSALKGNAPSASMCGQTPQGIAELEYQRTICALFNVYWLLRLDIDGKQGFCYGLHGDWEVRQQPPGSIADPCAGMKKPSESVMRTKFLESADWSKMQDMVISSLGVVGCASLDVERVEAMLCLTAFHDVLKMPWLCPRVEQSHAPYKGYSAGAVIQDHDIALSYVMEHYPELLPSYNVLTPQMQELVLFSQSKMQFNHGWFVQAEAPPGLMLGSLKSCLAAAQPGDLSFYFLHWLTDLSGAEGTPKCGAEKLVLRFPEVVLKSFLRSIPHLEPLREKTETWVMEQYLAARWRSMFPNDPLPTRANGIALQRLTVMAQGEAGVVAEAFDKLPISAQEILSEELALTGCQDQFFESCPMRGGPALLVYYGPALLQRCRGMEEMSMSLQILAAVLAAARKLWPLSLEDQGQTVLVDVGQLRMHDIRGIMCSAPATERSIWVVIPKNDRDASLELLPAGDANELNHAGTRYWVLDLRFAESDVLSTQNLKSVQI